MAHRRHTPLDHLHRRGAAVTPLGSAGTCEIAAAPVAGDDVENVVGVGASTITAGHATGNVSVEGSGEVGGMMRWNVGAITAS